MDSFEKGCDLNLYGCFSLQLSQVDWILDRTFDTLFAIIFFKVFTGKIFSHILQDYHSFFQWFDFRLLWRRIDLNNILITDKNAATVLREAKL